MSHDDLPDELDFDAGDMEPVDLTPLLTRRAVWDTTECDQVPGLLSALGLPPGDPEGMNREHDESHLRMAQVYPLEHLLQAMSTVMGTVLSRAMLEAKGAAGTPGVDPSLFAIQNAEVVLHGTRAIIAQLMAGGVIMYAPHSANLIVSNLTGDTDE